MKGPAISINIEFENLQEVYNHAVKLEMSYDNFLHTVMNFILMTATPENVENMLAKANITKKSYTNALSSTKPYTS